MLLLHSPLKRAFLGIKRNLSGSKARMALTKFEYVKSFEIEDTLEPLHWIVVSVYCLEHKEILKQNNVINESRLLFRRLLSSAGYDVMKKEKEISLGYGYSNTFHFILKRDTNFYKRREYKILSNIVSCYSSAFARNWSNFIDLPLSKLPIFNGEIYLFPQDQCLRDFLTIEQRKCHLVNLEETTIHNLISIAKLCPKDALEKVKNTSEGEKNELLFSLCNINYNNEPAEAKKGTIMIRNSETSTIESVCNKNNASIQLIYDDFIKTEFWDSYFPLNQTIKCFKLDYVYHFKRNNQILPHTFIVVRIDGRCFSKFSDTHKFKKPNDQNALNLMNHAAKTVMETFPIVKVSYGQSDEFSFVIKRFGHREKEGNSLTSRIVSVFSSAYANHWENHFIETQLEFNPVFDARLVLYPTVESVRDYLSWRQADCHINNMQNTCFWKLVNEKGLTRTKAQEYLNGTFSNDKRRILSEELGYNYDDDDPIFRKGSVIYNDINLLELIIKHCDIIGNKFWNDNPNLLEEKRFKS